MTSQEHGFRSQPNERYEMPIVFGPTELPQVSTWGYVHAIDISFVTDAAAVRPLVPIELDLPDEPTVLISRRTFDQVDYMAGHGYEELCVGISALHRGAHGSTRGNFWPVMWVDQVRPITVGREFTGFAKLGADFSPVSRTAVGSYSYEVSEYGAVLARGSVSNATPVDADRLSAIAAAGEVGHAFCARYVAPVDGGAGVDDVTRCEMRSHITGVSVGDATLELASPRWADAPSSARAISALAALPVLRLRPAYVIEGSSSFDRSTITALPRTGRNRVTAGPALTGGSRL